LGGGQGHCGCGFCGDAQAAASRIKARQTQRMWVIYLEIVAVLGLVAFILWFTWPKKPK
jgi:uncharacterized membrane protein YadS